MNGNYHSMSLNASFFTSVDVTPNHIYQIHNQNIDQVAEEKDLEIFIDYQMKLHQHSLISASKAMFMIGNFHFHVN